MRNIMQWCCNLPVTQSDRNLQYSIQIAGGKDFFIWFFFFSKKEKYIYKKYCFQQPVLNKYTSEINLEN